ncbi:Anti-sigma regulatory factor (Ser/Thr protein kinase) [Streptomyces sp. TLI_053]|uniref:ATP-binding protein n=1 Tax=Streptomyces sp. TLI_053 TaxID=1855352 RepID=UPI00087C48E6|nr:ATP-binding protein [Streptomyces sp. TLI_053]SDT75944.1 Anti-sigma regulatory factor (Ser/Thr protein kinase) [Streptomyces sp. TLI_053]
MCNRNTPSLTVAREALRSAMVRTGFHSEVIADAELALAELIVNAWRHGGTAAPVVLVLILGRTLRVSVGDDSSDLPECRTLAGFAESGRGLQLVQGLTHRWGSEIQKRGKLVWFELDHAA